MTCALLSRTFGCLALVCAILSLVALPEAGAEPPTQSECEAYCAAFLPSNPAGHAQCMGDCFLFGSNPCRNIQPPGGIPGVYYGCEAYGRRCYVGVKAGLCGDSPNLSNCTCLTP
jgi:hypothetical protein